MITLTGFDDNAKTPDEWRAYIDRLKNEQEIWLAKFRTEGLSKSDRIKCFSRADLIGDHIMRAEGVLKFALDHGLETATERERSRTRRH